MRVFTRFFTFISYRQKKRTNLSLIRVVLIFTNSLLLQILLLFIFILEG